MGWYGNGARRLQCRKELDDAMTRFMSSLSNKSNKLEGKNFTANVQDNYNFDVVPMLINNPTSQALIADINASTKDNVAIAIAFSHPMQSFDDVTDDVCQRLQGLFFYSSINVDNETFLRFIRRCPKIKSLTLAYIDFFDKRFLEQLFSEGLLPKLKFLEVSHADDDAIAAMYTAPNLQELVFRWPDPSITNAGFARLVENGEAKKLVAISAGTLQKDLSKSLTKSFLKVTLPKFVSGQAHESGLRHISVGKKAQMPPPAASRKAPPVASRKNAPPPPAVARKSALPPAGSKKVTFADDSKKAAVTRAAKDSLPFAVIPVERMSYHQLIDAIKNRGLAFPKPMSIVSMRSTLVEAGFTIQEEESIQNARHAKALSKDLSKFWIEKRNLEPKIAKVMRNIHSNKLYLDLTKDQMVSIMKKQYGGVSYKFNREEVANALHEKLYQGGGESNTRLAFLRKELAVVEHALAKTKKKIASLQARSDTSHDQKKKSSSKASTKAVKHPLATVN